MKQLNGTKASSHPLQIFKDVNSIDDLKEFTLPQPQHDKVPSLRHGHKLDVKVNDGVREVDVVQFQNYTATQRNRKRKLIQQTIAKEKLEKLSQGMFLIVQIKPTWEEYPHSFVVAEIQQNIVDLDTTDPNCEFEVQLYYFSTLTNIKSKLFPWRGAGGGGLWKEVISWSMLKAIVQV